MVILFILFCNCMLHISRNAVGICILTLCPTGLLNSLSSTMSLYLKYVSCRHHIVSSCLFICTVNLCLLMNVFSPFSLSVILIFYVWVYHLANRFLFIPVVIAPFPFAHAFTWLFLIFHFITSIAWILLFIFWMVFLGFAVYVF